MSKNLIVGMHLDVDELVWFKLGMVIDAVEQIHFVTSLIDLELGSRSQECKKAKTSVAIISQSF